MSHRARARGKERGAVAVEAAIVTPILIILAFGIIEFSFLFKDWMAMNSAVRAGVRIASAEPLRPNYATHAASQVQREASALNKNNIKEMWVYKAAADGKPIGGGGSFNACTQCVKFTWNGTAFAQVSDTWPSTQHKACAGLDRDTVGVYLEVERRGITGLFFGTQTLREYAVANFEPQPNTSPCQP